MTAHREPIRLLAEFEPEALDAVQELVRRLAGHLPVDVPAPEDLGGVELLRGTVASASIVELLARIRRGLSESGVIDGTLHAPQLIGRNIVLSATPHDAFQHLRSMVVDACKGMINLPRGPWTPALTVGDLREAATVDLRQAGDVLSTEVGVTIRSVLLSGARVSGAFLEPIDRIYLDLPSSGPSLSGLVGRPKR